MSHRKLPGAVGTTVIFLAVALASCQNNTIDNSNPVAPGMPVSFSQDVLPLLATTCAGSGCHVGQTTSGVNLSSYSDLMASTGVQYGRRIVTVSNAANSPIIDKIGPQPSEGARMPLGRNPLSLSSVMLLESWINDGALDN